MPPALKAPKGNQDLKVFKANQAPKGLRGRLALRGPRERLDRKAPKGKLGPKGPRARLVLRVLRANLGLRVPKGKLGPKGPRVRLVLRVLRASLGLRVPKGKLGPKGPRVRLVLRVLRARSARKENRVIQVPRGLLELMADIMNLMLIALEISVGLQARPECLLWQVRTSEGLKDPLAQTERQTVISP
ncbi:hypothetical protein [Flavonifractor plautii]|uniref:hypothetical protein n=1 Tax=Flavonifractor plautii TaxID=292800 RepID=UPI001FB02E9C|nr:hypothetical protein [Flavonifractor plautii]